ncbi:hypothetical protein IQ259_21730 [Fortiea sp. LEGE XX443]|uniref:hypothetical protein n=1 Tax=Fortiea sp. LEGE XX443 TaxID=1828611 RepID=UPI0018818A36|nr:hypothetical protein [Fortiea sp. LEGE XX443]MBE9007610.1 hypothetical protein [Fortiea sp. LEGE XX443]
MKLETRISSNFQPVYRPDSDQLKPYNTGLITLPIRIADYDQELELQLEAILDVDIENRDRAFRNRGREMLLLMTIKEEINKYFLQNVNLHKFVTELQYSIRQEIETSLNRALIDKGRKIAYLSFSSKSIDEIQNRFSLKQSLEIQDYQIDCFLKELKENIRVNNFINLQLIDLSSYRTAVANRLIPLDESGKPNLEIWVKQRLAQEINSILPNETFADLISEFEPIIANSARILENKNNNYSQKVFNAIESASRLIGYSVTRLISEPELEVRRRLALQDFLEIKDFLITCSVKDFEKEVTLNNTVQLQIADILKYITAIKSQQIPLNDEDGKPNLEKWAKQNLEKIIKSQFSQLEIVDLLPQQQQESYELKIATEIQKAADAIGYEVLQIISIPEFEIRKILGIKDFLEINDYPVSCTVKGFNKQIQVRNTLHLQIDDPYKYGIAIKNKAIPLNDQDETPSLEKWAGQKLEEIVKSLLLETEYVALFSEENTIAGAKNQTYESKVQDKIQEAAGVIGYRATQIISIPELEQVLALKENFNIETGEQEYPTRDADCSVALATTVVMRIENLQSIGKFLQNSENDLKTQIKNKIQESISRVMTKIELERFYMRFYYFDAQVRGETESVEKLISDAIEQQLKEHFQAVVISIILRICDTDLIQLFGDLIAINSDFEIEFQPINSDVEKVCLTGKFQVLSVGENDWYNFQSGFRTVLAKRKEIIRVIAELEEQRMQLERQTVVNGKEITALKQRIEAREAETCGIDLIRQNIESYLERIFLRFSVEQFRNYKIQDCYELKKDIYSWLGVIKNMYGLEIKVSQIALEITESKDMKDSASPTSPKPGLSKLKAQLRDKQDQLLRKEDQLKILEEDIDKIERRRNIASITQKHEYEARLEDLRHERDKLVQEKYKLHDEVEDIEEKIRNY